MIAHTLLLTLGLALATAGTLAAAAQFVGKYDIGPYRDEMRLGAEMVAVPPANVGNLPDNDLSFRQADCEVHAAFRGLTCRTPMPHLADALREVRERRPMEALAALDADGRLDRKALVGKESLASVMERLAAAAAGAAPLRQERLRRAVAQLLIETADPRAIFQGWNNTCGPAAVQVWLATVHPAEYARIAAGLLLGQKVRLVSGEPLTPTDSPLDQGWGDEIRALPSRAFQDALVRLKQGEDDRPEPLFNWRSYGDRSDRPFVLVRQRGFSPYRESTGGSELQRLLTAVSGERAIIEWKMYPHPDPRHALMEQVRVARPTPERPLIILWRPPEIEQPLSFHYGVVTRFDPYGFVELTDTAAPSGRIPARLLERSVQLVVRVATPPADAK